VISNNTDNKEVLNSEEAIREVKEEDKANSSNSSNISNNNLGETTIEATNNLQTTNREATTKKEDEEARITIDSSRIKALCSSKDDSASMETLKKEGMDSHLPRSRTMALETAMETKEANNAEEETTALSDRDSKEDCSLTLFKVKTTP
jgi:hypothetical protein